jgi:hypothetical protein
VSSHTLSARLDKLGVGLSVACLIHCLLTPVLVVFLPIAGGFFAGEHFHALLLAIILPTSLIALLLGCQRHGRLHVLLLGGAGILLMAIAVASHTIIGDGWERVLTGLGGAVLATGHILNYRHCRNTGCES